MLANVKMANNSSAVQIKPLLDLLLIGSCNLKGNVTCTKTLTENEGYETWKLSMICNWGQNIIWTIGVDWLMVGRKKTNRGCPRDLTTRKRETCCWPGACFQAENGNNSSKWKRGRQQCGNTKTTKHILTTLKAFSCLPKSVNSRENSANAFKN